MIKMSENQKVELEGILFLIGFCISLFMACCFAFPKAYDFFVSTVEAQTLPPEICQLELMANHIEWQGDLFVGCEFSSGRVDLDAFGTLTLTNNSAVVIEAQEGQYQVRAEYTVIPDSPDMFYCYRQVVNATGALVRITNTATGEVCEPDLMSNVEEVYAEFNPNSFTAWIHSGGIQTDLLMTNLVRTEISTLEPEPIQQQVCEADYWREQFRIMAAKRDEQKARGNYWLAKQKEMAEKRNVQKDRGNYWKARYYSGQGF